MLVARCGAAMRGVSCMLQWSRRPLPRCGNPSSPLPLVRRLATTKRAARFQMFFSTESSRGRGTPKNAFEALAMLEKELLGVAAGSGSGTGGEGSAAEDEDPDAERRLNVGIIGEPNVGKSSLLNLLVNSPVSAVSPKRNTTRDSIVGIHMSGNTQLVFYDTPGFMQKEVHREFFQPLQNSVVSMCRTVDVILLVIDAARRLDLKMFNVVQDLGKACEVLPVPPQVVLVLNKVDLVDPKEQLLEISERLHEEALQYFPQGMLPTCYTDCRKAQSADTTAVKRSEPLTTNPLTESEEEDEILEAMLEEASRYDGVQDVIDQLILLAKPGEWDFEPDAVTDMEPEERALEAVKEAVFQCCHKELPYLVSPQTIDFIYETNDNGGQFVIRHRLEVKSKSHARILGGPLLQAIRRKAQKTLEQSFGERVNLDLTVRVAPRR